MGSLTLGSDFMIGRVLQCFKTLNYVEKQGLNHFRSWMDGRTKERKDGRIDK